MRLAILLLSLLLFTNSSTASFNGLSEELRFIHQEMGSLRAENYKQNMEIAGLKETVQLQNKTINQHETAIKELTSDYQRILIKGNHPEPSAVMPRRRKRPVQLIPGLYVEQKSFTDEKNVEIFYGPPTSCSDLNRLGYTLNGFYQVNKAAKKEENITSITNLKTIYCAFKQEGNYNPNHVEKPVNPSSVPLSPFNFPSFSILDHLNMPNNDVYFFARIYRFKVKQCYGRLTFHNTADGDIGQTIENIGNNFNGETGYFTASKNGIYHFFYETLFGGRGNGAKVDFYLNDVIVPNPISYISEDDKGTMSIQVTLKLKEKDSICLKVSKRNNITNVSRGSDPFTESLTGVLLKAMIH